MYNALYYAVFSSFASNDRAKHKADVTKISRARVGYQRRSHADEISRVLSQLHGVEAV